LEAIEADVITLSRVASRKKAAIAAPWKRVIAVTAFVFCFIALINVNIQAEKTLDYYIGAFGSLPFVYFLFKMVCSFLYKPEIREPLPGIKVSVVVPSYNEDPDAVMKTIECLLEQDYPIHEIFFIDDGSVDTRGYEVVKKLSEEINAWKEVAVTTLEQNSRDKWARVFMEYPNIIVHRFEQNRGKRNAQVFGFQHATGDVLMIVDSDGYIYPDAVRELLKPFHDEKVVAVTGHVNARNRDDNMVTRLQDVLYESAFRVGRGAMSLGGNVIVCSGAISMFRREVVLEHLDEFKDEKLFGKSVQVGDDRRLTTISLSVGKVKYQSTARCITDVPTSLRKFFKQQVRWSKSFYVESLKAFKVAWKTNRPLLMLWILGEGLIWALFGSSVILSWVLNSWAMKWPLLVYALGYLTFTTLANNVFYLLKRPHIYLLSPFFGLVHMMLIYPIRFYALLTLNSNGWGTR
jgi:hyaluronan synthase